MAHRKSDSTTIDRDCSFSTALSHVLIGARLEFLDAAHIKKVHFWSGRARASRALNSALFLRESSSSLVVFSPLVFPLFSVGSRREIFYTLLKKVKRWQPFFPKLCTMRRKRREEDSSFISFRARWMFLRPARSDSSFPWFRTLFASRWRRKKSSFSNLYANVHYFLKALETIKENIYYRCH